MSDAIRPGHVGPWEGAVGQIMSREAGDLCVNTHKTDTALNLPFLLNLLLAVACSIGQG